MSVSDKANTLRAQDHGHPPVICIQGGGTTSIGKQNGDGYSSSGVAYTVNAVDVHGVCYGLSRSLLKGGENGGGIPVGNNIQPAMTANGCGAVCFDARGNGEGGVVPTITGDHNGHLNDYMAVLVMKR